MKRFFKKLKYNLHKLNIFRYIKNYFLCLRYPFMRLRNVWTDKPCGYSYTWYDAIPYGWRKAFGKQLLKELKVALKKEGRLKDFRFHDIKEKWGELCLYHNGVGEYSNYVLNKYEKLSLAYCINCGKPVRYITKCWVNYVCQDCRDKGVKNGESTEHYCRLTKDDIPYVVNYAENDITKINYKDVYDVDFIKLWDLKK